MLRQVWGGGQDWSRSRTVNGTFRFQFGDECSEFQTGHFEEFRGRVLSLMQLE